MNRRQCGLTVAALLAVVLIPAVAAGTPGIVDVVEHDTTAKGPGSIEVVLNETVVAADDGQQLDTDDFVFVQSVSGTIDDVGDPGSGDVFRVASVTGDSTSQRRVVVGLERYNASSGTWEPYRVPPTADLAMNLSAVESTATGTVVDPPTQPVSVTSWDLNRSDAARDTPATALAIKRGSVLALDAEESGFNVTVIDDSTDSVVFGPVNTGDGHAAVLDTSGLDTGPRTYRVRFEKNDGATVATRYVNVSMLDLSLSPTLGTYYLGTHNPIAGDVQTDRAGRTGETVSGHLVDGSGTPVEPAFRFAKQLDGSGFRNLTLVDPVDIPREPITGIYTIHVVDDLTGQTVTTDVTVACGRISSPTVVDDPGCYVVSQSATDSTASTYLNITASNVTVRGAGHTLDGVDDSGTVGVQVGSGTERVEVQNLTVTDFGIGVVAVNASDPLLEDLEVRSNPLMGILSQGGSGLTVSGGRASGNTNGVRIEGTSDVDLAGVVVEGNVEGGMTVENAGTVGVSGVSVEANGGHGVSAAAVVGLRLSGGDVVGNAGGGIAFTNVSASTIDQVRAADNGRSGVVFNRSDGNRITDSTLTNNGRYGLTIGGRDAGSHDNQAEGIDAGGNALAAVRIRGPDFEPSTNNSLAGVNVGSARVDVRGRYVRVNGSLSPPGPPGGWYGTDDHATVKTVSGVKSQVALRFAYQDSHVGGLEESSLGTLQYRDGTWNETASTLHATGNRISTNLSTDGVVGVFAEELLFIPQLTQSTSSIRFGQTALGNTRTDSVTLTNTGNETMALDDPELSGATAAFDAGGAPSTLEPGESATIGVSFRPRGSGEVSATLTIPTNASDGQVELQGTGVDFRAAVSPSTIDFGTHLVGQRAEEGVTVTNTGDLELTPEGVAITGRGADGYAVEGTLPAELEPGASANLTLRFEPTTNGTHPATLEIPFEENAVGPLTVDLAGAGLDRSIAVSETSLSFEDVPPGTTEMATLRVTNDGGSPVELRGIIDGEDTDAFETEPHESIALDPGEQRTLDVRYTPRERGTDEATLTLSDSGGHTLAAVNLSGQARAGELRVTPRSLSFANATPGEPARRTVSVSNEGNAPIEVVATHLLGPGAYDVANGGSFTLGPGQERTLTVTYTPTRSEPTAGLVRVLTDDARHSNETVYVTNTPARAAVDVRERADRTHTNVTFRNATAGEPVSIPVVDDRAGENLSVSTITVTPTVTTTFAVDVVASADPLSTTPPFQLGDGTTPLGHLRISHNLSNENIETVSFRYRVQQDSLAALGTDADAVSMYRHEDEEWVAKPTTVRNVTDGVVFLRTTADGLSEWTAAARKPRFNVSDTDTSIDSGVVGDDVTIQVFVRNTGGAEGVYVAELLLNGVVVDRQEATVPDGGKRALNFQRSFDEPGSYQIQVNDIFVGEVDISGAKESVEVNTDGTPVGGDGDGDGGDGGESADSESDGGGGIPVLLIVLVAALAVIGVGAWLVVGREDAAAQDGPVETDPAGDDGPVVTEAGGGDESQGGGDER